MWRNLDENMRRITDAAKSGSLIVLNIATTGLGSNAGIIEITARRTAFRKGGFRPYDALHLYINPCMLVGRSVAVHGITDGFLQGKPTSEEVRKTVGNFFDMKSHICSFSDYPVRMMSERFGGICAKNTFLDLSETARDAMCGIRMPEKSLRMIAARRGMPFSGDTQPGIETNDILIGLLNSFTAEIGKSAKDRKNLPVPEVLGVNFVKGYRNTMDRIYVNLDCGTVYYEQKTDYWGDRDENADLVGRIDMNAVQARVLEITGCGTYTELRKYRGDRKMPERTRKEEKRTA